jgi:hypothetical protein
MLHLLQSTCVVEWLVVCQGMVVIFQTKSVCLSVSDSKTPITSSNSQDPIPPLTNIHWPSKSVCTTYAPKPIHHLILKPTVQALATFHKISTLDKTSSNIALQSILGFATPCLDAQSHSLAHAVIQTGQLLLGEMSKMKNHIFLKFFKGSASSFIHFPLN